MLPKRLVRPITAAILAATAGCERQLPTLTGQPAAAPPPDDRAREIARRAHERADELARGDVARYAYLFDRIFRDEWAEGRPAEVKAEEAAAPLPAPYDEAVFLHNRIRNIDNVRGGRMDITVIGGKPDERDEHPDCVAIKHQGRWVGSGVLISRKAVLTAAHNFGVPSGMAVVDARRVKVGLGPTATDPGLPVSKVWLFETYLEETGADDIAVVLLKDELPVGTAVCSLGDKALADCAGTVRAAGYGAAAPGDVYLGKRKWVGLTIRFSPVTARTACSPNPPEQVLGIPCRIDHEVATWGSLEGDTCEGDSGGPIYALRGNGSLAVVALVRRGTNAEGEHMVCGQGAMHTRVDPYIPWIKQKAGLP